MGISRASRYKRRDTGGKRPIIIKKRKHELGRQASMTKIGASRVHTVRVRGGNTKFRALRLDMGNFSWGSESITKKVRVVDVVYNATNNELVRTKTLVKGSIIQVDAAPFRQWYESHYGKTIGRVRADYTPAAMKDTLTEEQLAARQAESTVESDIIDQFNTGRLYARISSRPGQVGRCDGYILEGAELDFYLRKLRK
ncbi:30S ribosomal protein S8e [Fonticula alba]|uniref:40S ribosomal protein S8 n=1 Tax=Fonticula alba TaxID=691883 RepID=A0A058ZIN1_FONAL|nr:30S ribosomal protein S8e [Fonticula alba]KCV73377.1 30S ribosomal protein S8e [Fonticula alba]|eukprot:XP_009493078.1 30S ribosomal protein S8e [Fonticula alba]